jgi:hypothetical protein
MAETSEVTTPLVPVYPSTISIARCHSPAIGRIRGVEISVNWRCFGSGVCHDGRDGARPPLRLSFPAPPTGSYSTRWVSFSPCAIACIRLFPRASFDFDHLRSSLIRIGPWVRQPSNPSSLRG